MQITINLIRFSVLHYLIAICKILIMRTCKKDVLGSRLRVRREINLEKVKLNNQKTKEQEHLYNFKSQNTTSHIN